MKLLILFISICVPCMAQVPSDPKVEDFAYLLRHSPFRADNSAPIPNVQQPLNTQYTLRGVSRFDDGWRVTLTDLTNPTSIVRVYEKGSSSSSGIRLIKVNQNTQNLFKTTVEIVVNGKKTTVGYDAEAIKKRRASSVQNKTDAKKTSQPVTSTKSNLRPTQQVESANNKSVDSVRRPRVRRVVPSQ